MSRWGLVLVVTMMFGLGCTPRTKTPLVRRTPYDPALSTQLIEFNKGRVKRDPAGAIGWSLLASAYLTRSREHDSATDAKLAESAARRSLELRTKNNESAASALVNALLQQHRFKEAREAANQLNRIAPDSDQACHLQAETAIEMGDYAEAKGLIERHLSQFADPSGNAIKARLLELTGRNEEAARLYKEALAAVEANVEAPAAVVAWFHTKLGQCLWGIGQADEAKIQLETSVSLYPYDYKACGSLARLFFGKGQWNEAIRWGEQANRIAPLPDTLALVGDAYAELDKKRDADRLYDAAENLASTPSGGNSGVHEAVAATTHGHSLDRQYAMFCADHERNLDSAYAAVLRDFGNRHDAYAFDSLAWVLLKRGQRDEAGLSIQKALDSGLRDASVFYHAARIFEALGKADKARSFDSAALALNPSFNARYVRVAQRSVGKAAAG